MQKQLNLVNELMPLYKGCNIREIALIFTLCSALSFALLTVFSLMVFNSMLPVVIGNIFPSLLLTFICLNILSRYKEDKPAGFDKVSFYLWLAKTKLYHAPFIEREGCWEVRRDA